jgi:Spy/CpxP family protein refolding chaperone
MKNWKSILLLVLVFLAGIGVGALGVRVAVRRAVQLALAHPERGQLQTERSLAKKLWLDETQRQQLHKIMTEARGQLRDLRRDFQPQILAVTQAAEKKIAGLLTAEQLTRYEKIKKEERGLFPGVRPAP